MRRAGERPRGYPSDLTDAQWQIIVPHLPAYVPGQRGRPRVWPLRAIVDAILYLDRAGCAWRYLPDSFPPWPTVYGYFAAWRDDGTLARLHDALRARVRAAAGRDPQPTAAVIDSQSVRAADTVPKSTRGWDNAKKVNGRKRHIAVDSMGLLLAVVITAASVQDRDAARPLLWNLHRTSRRIRLIWADAVYTGKLAAWAAALKMTLQIVPRRNPHAFEVLPRRWVVERTFAWISKHRRTVRDYERLPASHEAMILWAMTALMAGRLAQPSHLSNTHLALLGGGSLELGHQAGGIRPRSFTSTPCALAHTRIWVVFRPPPGRGGCHGLACGRCRQPGGQHSRTGSAHPATPGGMRYLARHLAIARLPVPGHREQAWCLRRRHLRFHRHGRNLAWLPRHPRSCRHGVAGLALASCLCLLSATATASAEHTNSPHRHL